MSDLSKLVFIDSDEHEWLDTLDNYEKEIVIELLEASSSYQEAASIWLEASTDTTSPFGTDNVGGQKKYFNRLQDHVRKLLCGDAAYENERKEVTELVKRNVPKESVISTISALIGAKMGLAATFLAPAIVIIFMIISKVSLNAWCEMKTFQDVN
ncbi:hypothetical protein [Priestia aryabhattai]|uniref:hypothetical protein n=1 Tax=Priestia aryabhattai TaxID=412384 RepID=UPI0036BBDC8B